MATRERGDSTASRPISETVGRTALVGVAAAVQAVALGVWLALVQTSPTTSVATALAFAALAGGLVAKHAATDVAVNGAAASFPGPRAIGVAAAETGAWAIWLLIADRVAGLAGLAVAGVAVAALLVPLHTVESAVLRGERPGSNLVDFDALGFSLAEAGGATVWLLLVLRGELVEPLLADADALVGDRLPFELAAVDPALVGLAALAAALFVERFVAVGFSRHG